MSTTYNKVTCVFTVNAVGAQSATALSSLMSAGAIPVPTWISLLYGATVFSDLTFALEGNVIIRTIVFNIGGTTFQTRFANAASVFWGKMNGLIRAAINQPAIDAAPVPGNF